MTQEKPTFRCGGCGATRESKYALKQHRRVCGATVRPAVSVPEPERTLHSERSYIMGRERVHAHGWTEPGQQGRPME